MKAVVYYAPKDIRVEEMSIPGCDANEVRVKVDACAVCGTDLKSFHSHRHSRYNKSASLQHFPTGPTKRAGFFVRILHSCRRHVSDDPCRQSLKHGFSTVVENDRGTHYYF